MEVKLKEETELWEPRGPCGSWGPAEEPRGPCGSWGPAEEPRGPWGPSEEHTHSEALDPAHVKEEEPELSIKQEPQEFHLVIVKTEDDEDKSSVLHQSEENREETNGWDCGAEAGCSSVCEEEHLKVEEELLNGEDDGAESDWSWEWEGPPLRQTLSERRTASTMEPNPGEVQVLWRRGPGSETHHQSEENEEDTDEEHTDSSEDTDHSEDYGQEQAPAKRSYAMVPPDAEADRPYTCPECGKRFQSQQCLKRHVSVHSGQKPHKCSVCGKNYRQKQTLDQHLRNHHLICPVCGEQFPDKMKLNEHLINHVEDGALEQSVLQREKPHICSECGKEFRTKSHLQRHMFVHTGQKRFKCSLCDKGFIFRFEVKVHLRFVHRTCPVCKKNFKRFSGLTEHLKTHVEDGTLDPTFLKRGGYMKPCRCSFCGKEFQRKQQLQIHTAVHTGDTPFKCSVCGKSFPNNYRLQRHMLVHSEERPHQCPVCEKTFKLKRHLQRHMSVHSGEKPHRCPECSKRFPKKQDLKNHMNVHSVC